MSSKDSIMIVAGEASADTHGARLVEALRQRRPDVQAWGVGGAGMRNAGFEAIVDAERISVAGLTEVIFAIPRIWMILRRLAREVRRRRPQVVVLIDLPDFNLRLARRIKKLGIPVVYYISPQIWAWRQERVEQIRELVTQMLCILPFEQSFYQKHGVRAQFVGHPLVDALPAPQDRNVARAALSLPASPTPVIALLPGSRKKEVTRLLPVMLEGVRLLKHRFPDATAVIPVASTISRSLVQKLVDAVGIRAYIIDERASDALAAADAAVVCSGTATLQAALLSRPMVVVYRVSWLTYRILKRMVKVAHIALVNLIAGHRLVPELVQQDLTAESVEAELRKLLDDPAARIRLNQEFKNIRRSLGQGDTAKQVASVVLNYLPDPVAPPRPAPTGTVPAVRARTEATSHDA